MSDSSARTQPTKLPLLWNPPHVWDAWRHQTRDARGVSTGVQVLYVGTMNAQHWMDRLNLQPHPEGGYYRETYRAPLILPCVALPAHGGGRSACTAIYFLLTGEQFSAFHRIRSDEIWHFYAGSTLIVHVITPAGEYKQIPVGYDAEQGGQFQAVVPAGCWFGSSLRDPSHNNYALVGCTVAPGFDFADFELARRRELSAQFPQHRAIIDRLTHP